MNLIFCIASIDNIQIGIDRSIGHINNIIYIRTSPSNDIIKYITEVKYGKTVSLMLNLDISVFKKLFIFILSCKCKHITELRIYNKVVFYFYSDNRRSLTDLLYYIGQ